MRVEIFPFLLRCMTSLVIVAPVSLRRGLVAVECLLLVTDTASKFTFCAVVYRLV